MYGPFVAPSAARCLADLRWLLQSPPLLSLTPRKFSAPVQAFNAQQAHEINAWLDGLDAAHVQAFVETTLPAKAPMRLGRYAEQLMAYFLNETDLFELIAANVPLRRHGVEPTLKTHTTIGEFDYLIQDSVEQCWHWEMAVKFYLCHPTGNSAVAHDFKGPAGKDTLGLKLNKVFGKQLTHLPPAPYDSIHWRPAAYARGWMFYLHGLGVIQCDALNPLHLNGWWLNVAAFKTAAFDSVNFVHLPRLHWLAPYSLNELPVLNQAEMADDLMNYWRTADAKQAEAGQMVACVVPSEGGWREISRGFVLPVASTIRSPTLHLLVK